MAEKAQNFSTCLILLFTIFNLLCLVRLSSRVVDPYSFFPDPDPEFKAGDQSGSNPDPGL
jgi:hypothetical protein